MVVGELELGLRRPKNSGSGIGLGEGICARNKGVSVSLWSDGVTLRRGR